MKPHMYRAESCALVTRVKASKIIKISTSRRAHAIIVLSTIGPQLEIVGIDEVVLQVALGEVELKRHP